jgi:predicted Zn-dependent peptidase
MVMTTMKNKLNKLPVWITLALSFGMLSCSFGPAASAADWKTPLIPVTKDFKLANGMRCILSEDHSVPVASLAIVYDVGARDEKKGRSGFAHLFEHMMFEGSDNVGKNEFFKYVEGAGGSLNASTHPDFTNYFEKLPSNQIELALWLESDRMRSLKITAENFQNQLQTVKEEKRMRIDNQPYTPAAIRFEEIMYDNWANAHPVIGSFEDLEASSTQDVKQFFTTYYAPNNAVLAIVGDIDSEKMAKLIEKYFGSIASQPQPSRPDVSEPVQAKAKYEKMPDAQAKLPAFWIGWKAPAKRDPDYYPLAVIEKLLGAGESSRLYQRMVKGDQVALKIDSGIDSRRGPEAFEAFVVVKPGNSPDKVRQILFSELEKLKATPVSETELEKSRNQILRELFASGSYSSLQRSLGRAEMLAEYTSFWGDPSLIDKDLDAFMKVTPADIQRVAAKVFNEANSTVIDVNPVAAKSGDKASLDTKPALATNSSRKIK